MPKVMIWSFGVYTDWILSLFSPSEECRSVGGGKDSEGFHSHKGKEEERTSILVAGAQPAAVCGQKQAQTQTVKAGQGKLTFLPRPSLTSRLSFLAVVRRQYWAWKVWIKMFSMSAGRSFWITPTMVDIFSCILVIFLWFHISLLPKSIINRELHEVWVLVYNANHSFFCHVFYFFCLFPSALTPYYTKTYNIDTFVTQKSWC